MRPRFIRPLLLFALAAGAVGCARGSREQADEGTITEGILFSVEYELGDGRTGGFTRLNLSAAVPGGNGSWNVDAYGRLTRDYLLVTYPQKKDLGPRVIPARRLVDVQFGDGGIEQVAEGEPAPAG
ncbi:MAG TPA: hypothetical protein VF170_03135 [Planctomycetaceae bacterium]